MVVIACEQQFELPIVNPETGKATPVFTLGGKIDKIVKLADGRVAVVEHKTTGDPIGPDSAYWQRLSMDPQISTYWLAAQQLGHDVQTVVYDVIHKPGINMRKLTKAEIAAWQSTGKYCGSDFDFYPQIVRETPGMYGARLGQDIRSRPDFYYARQEIPRLASDIEEFRFDLWHQQQMIRESQRLGRWPRRTESCTSPYKCEYLEVCRYGFDENNLPSGFVKLTRLHQELIRIVITRRARPLRPYSKPSIRMAIAGARALITIRISPT